MIEFDPNDKSYGRSFSPPEENGEQITGKGNRVLTINYTLEIQTEGLITYSMDQQIFKFNPQLDTKAPYKPSILDSKVL